MCEESLASAFDSPGARTRDCQTDSRHFDSAMVGAWDVKATHADSASGDC